MDYLAEQKLHYTVERPMDGTLWVEGFGIATYVSEVDEEALKSLVDPVSHEERKKQYKESPEQTQRRREREERKEMRSNGKA